MKPNNGGIAQNAFDRIFWDALSAEERELVGEIPQGEEKLLFDEIALLTVRERRLMRAIQYAGDGTRRVSDEKLESELTRIQNAKKSCIDLLKKVRAGQDAASELADDWIAGLQAGGEHES